MSMFYPEIDFLDPKYQGRCIAVEFEHGSYCKKAIGFLEDIGSNFIRLVSKPGYWPFIKVKIYSGSNPPHEELVTEIIIINKSIVAVELEPYEYRCTRVEKKPEKMQIDVVHDIKLEEDKKFTGSLKEIYSCQNKRDTNLFSKAKEIEQETVEGNSLIKSLKGELVLKSVVPLDDNNKEDDRNEEDRNVIYYEEKGTCEGDEEGVFVINAILSPYNFQRQRI